MNGKCFSFHNEEVKSFREAHKTCHDTFLRFGFQNGKMYEPRDLIEFEEVYKMAEEFSKTQALTIWLGINDIEFDGEFAYNTYQGETPFIVKDAPWGKSRKGGKTYLQPWQKGYRPL